MALRFAGDVTTVHELSEGDSMTLLERLAPKAVEAEPYEARELVRAVGGLPLALILMGYHLRVETYSGQPRRLRRVLNRLHQVSERLRLAEPRALSERHPSLPEHTWVSLQAIIEISDSALDEVSRSTLRALSVFHLNPTHSLKKPRWQLKK